MLGLTEMARGYVMATVPTPGQVISVVLEMSTFGVLCMCFSKSFMLVMNLSIKD